MSRVSTDLNFPRSAEAAFSFCRSVFQTDPIARFKDIPADPSQPPLADADKNDRIRWMFNCASKV